MVLYTSSKLQNCICASIYIFCMLQFLPEYSDIVLFYQPDYMETTQYCFVKTVTSQSLKRRY